MGLPTGAGNIGIGMPALPNLPNMPSIFGFMPSGQQKPQPKASQPTFLGSQLSPTAAQEGQKSLIGS